MAATPKSIQSSMEAVIAGLKKQLDDLSTEMFSRLPNKKRKYTEAERDELNNLRAKLSQEIFHREVMAAFDAATVTVVRQPTVAESDALKATLVELGKPLTAKANAFAVVDFVEDLMSTTAKRFNELVSTLSSKK